MPVYYDECPSCGGKKDTRSVQCRQCNDGPFPETKVCTVCKQELPVTAYRIRTRKIPRPRSQCKACEAEKQRERHKKTPNEILNRKRRAWERKNPEKHKLQQWRRRCRAAGIIEEDIPLVLDRLKEKKECDICGEGVDNLGGKNKDTLTIDHDHNTGAFRGLLCNRCNLGIGHFQDCTGNLERAIQYLKNPPR